MNRIEKSQRYNIENKTITEMFDIIRDERPTHREDRT